MASQGRSLVLDPNLTRAELAVARLMAHGLRNKEIAAARVVSTATVNKQIATILAKLGVHSRTAAVQWMNHQDGKGDRRMIAKLYQPVFAPDPDSPEGIWKTLPTALVLDRGTFLAGDEWLFRIARVTYMPDLGEIRYDSEDNIEPIEALGWVNNGGWTWEDA